MRKLSGVLAAASAVAVLAGSGAAQAAPAQTAKVSAGAPAITYAGWPWMTVRDRPVPYEPEIQIHFKIHKKYEPTAKIHVTMWIMRWAAEGGPYVFKEFKFGNAQFPELGHTKELTFDVLCRPGTYYTKWEWTSSQQETSIWYWPHRPKVSEPQNSVKPPDRHESRHVGSC